MNGACLCVLPSQHPLISSTLPEATFYVEHGSAASLPRAFPSLATAWGLVMQRPRGLLSRREQSGKRWASNH